ncbi:MAG: tetratricopeptide repeat protein [Bryobacteraceae bacterium]
MERLLLRSDEVIPLTPKAIDTLLVLLANPGRVLEKEELIRTVWPDSFVEEGGLARNISALRRVLGDLNSEVQYIETIPKRGYRFVAPVTEVSAEPEVQISAPTPSGNLVRLLPRQRLPPKPSKTTAVLFLMLVGVLVYFLLIRPAPSGALQLSSLVVLPLNNLSDDPDQEFFTEAMTDELINSLAKIEALRVISRTSAMTYRKANKPLPQIARELHVDGVVEGSVLKVGEKVRITVQLFHAKSDKQLWARSYERDLRDILTLQSDLASSIAQEIQVKLTPGEKQRLATARTVDPEAYLAYSYGRYYWNKRSAEGFQKGIEYFQRAIAKDPSYAPAYAGLADVYALLASTAADLAAPLDVMPKQKAAATHAVRLDSSLSEGHSSLGYSRLSYDWDLTGAEQEFKRAIELNPGYSTARLWYAHYLLATDQVDQAIAEVKRAQTLDPFSLSINLEVGWCLYHARRYDEAVEQYKATIEMNPSFSLAHSALGMAYEAQGAYSEAVSEFKEALALPGNPLFPTFGLGRAYGLSGKRREAGEILAQLVQRSQKQYVPSVYIAALYDSVGDREQGIRYLLKAYHQRADYLIYLKTEPVFDGMRSDMRFQALIGRIKNRD